MSGESGAMILDAYVVARFWAKTDVRRPGECWEWRAACNEHGYGVFRLPNMHRNIKAHRMAWWITYGHAPTKNLLHSCDNPACVNPSHLSEGTQAENIADMNRKGRGRGIRHSRLTVEHVRGIRASSAPYSELATQYSVTESYISMIRGGLRLKEGIQNVR